MLTRFQKSRRSLSAIEMKLGGSSSSSDNEDNLVCKRINNFEVVLWRLLDENVISLKNYTYLRSQSEAMQKRRALVAILQTCYNEDSSCHLVIATVLEETDNLGLKFLLQQRNKSYARESCASN